MKEKYDPKLKIDKKSYGKTLREVGMPERIRQEKIPLHISKGEALYRIVPGMESLTLEVFLALPEEIQDGIVEDVEKQRKAGMDKGDILARVKILVKKGKELESMSEDSDKNYTPKPKISLQEIERKEADKFATGGVDQAEGTEPEEN